ncbi:Uncharacterised protein [Streptobacillus moniliformis]|nr:Uncharacterised protein [Streptobacillus moniliformis]
MSEIVKYILGISPSILLPIIIIIMSLFMKMKLKDALMSGITLANCIYIYFFGYRVYV